MTTTTTTKPATKPAQEKKARASKGTTKPAQKPESKAATKPASVGAFASVYDALKACGITQKPNLAGHIKAGRINKDGSISKAGAAYFASRLPEDQQALKGFMAKAGKNGFKTGSGYVFAPVENAPVSHAPVNPGSYAAPIIRAWFSALVATIKA